jgi:hypothetical protein
LDQAVGVIKEPGIAFKKDVMKIRKESVEPGGRK